MLSQLHYFTFLTHFTLFNGFHRKGYYYYRTGKMQKRMGTPANLGWDMRFSVLKPEESGAGLVS